MSLNSFQGEPSLLRQLIEKAKENTKKLEKYHSTRSKLFRAFFAVALVTTSTLFSAVAVFAAGWFLTLIAPLFLIMGSVLGGGLALIGSLAFVSIRSTRKLAALKKAVSDVSHEVFKNLKNQLRLEGNKSISLERASEVEVLDAITVCSYTLNLQDDLELKELATTFFNQATSKLTGKVDASPEQGKWLSKSRKFVLAYLPEAERVQAKLTYDLLSIRHKISLYQDKLFQPRDQLKKRELLAMKQELLLWEFNLLKPQRNLTPALEQLRTQLVSQLVDLNKQLVQVSNLPFQVTSLHNTATYIEYGEHPEGEYLWPNPDELRFFIDSAEDTELLPVIRIDNGFTPADPSAVSSLSDGVNYSELAARLILAETAVIEKAVDGETQYYLELKRVPGFNMFQPKESLCALKENQLYNGALPTRLKKAFEKLSDKNTMPAQDFLTNLKNFSEKHQVSTRSLAAHAHLLLKARADLAGIEASLARLSASLKEKGFFASFRRRYFFAHIQKKITKQLVEVAVPPAVDLGDPMLRFLPDNKRTDKLNTLNAARANLAEQLGSLLERKMRWENSLKKDHSKNKLLKSTSSVTNKTSSTTKSQTTYVPEPVVFVERVMPTYVEPSRGGSSFARGLLFGAVLSSTSNSRRGHHHARRPQRPVVAPHLPLGRPARGKGLFGGRSAAKPPGRTGIKPEKSGAQSGNSGFLSNLVTRRTTTGTGSSTGIGSRRINTGTASRTGIGSRRTNKGGGIKLGGGGIGSRRTGGGGFGRRRR